MTNVNRRLALFSIAFLISFSTAFSQTQEDNSDRKEWIFTASTYVYAVPHSQVYANPNLTADRGRLHLEARYNYESLETASVWVGYKFSCGEKLVFEVTPMVGGVFGKLNGVAPGYLSSLTYKKFDVTSQGELVITGNRDNNFFYTWTELGYSPVSWFRGGLVIQRTKAYETPFDIQRGVMAGFSYKKMEIGTYVFNLEKKEQTVVGAIVWNF
jgi:hypothetical protein